MGSTSPGLPEADSSSVGVVPLDFREEVDRAVAAKSMGWLRLLAQDLQSLRFRWAGLRLIGDAQWKKLKDYSGARDTFESIRGIYPDDPIANLALASIYERLSRTSSDKQLLVSSDQAIARVLISLQATPQNRVEALTLRGRNLKTRWRRELEMLSKVEERRRVAMSQTLRDAFEAYSDAFRQDLNHFWSGLVALQMGTIFLELSTAEDSTWKNTFDDDASAQKHREQIEREIKALRTVVPASIEAALLRLTPNDDEYAWARISKVDVLFLDDAQTPERIVSRYRDAISEDKPFTWDAAKGQLELFASLGVKTDLAQKVIQEIDPRFKDGKKTERPIHVVMFTGHRIDLPGRAEPRFPEAAVEQVKTAVCETLSEFAKAHELIGFASAAPGADILFHEVCCELKIKSTICLPMPRADYARFAFEDLDVWRSRYLSLLGRIPQTLELGSPDGLARWLHGSGVSPWERGNQLVLQMALAMDAEQYTLLTLWDGQETDDDIGGTAHMIGLARAAGNSYIKTINLKDLLA